MPIAWLLVGAFILTIASFVAATVMSERQARGIGTAARSIAVNASPSIHCLARSRTDLRQAQMLLVELTNRGSGRAEPDAASLSRARDALLRGWEACERTPKYPGEQDVQERIGADLKDLSTAIDELRTQAGSSHGAVEVAVARARRAVNRVDWGMVQAIELNARESAALGVQIESLREEYESRIAYLHVFSAVFAAALALIMLEVLRRFTRLMEGRVSDLEDFAGRVAHDIRSPLGSVALALELTKRDPAAGISRGVIDRASKTLQRVGQLVDGLLIFARAGTPPAEGVRADVGEVLDGVIEEMRPSAAENGITMQVERPSASMAVACSPGVLISILSNLIGNGIKYMGSSPVRCLSIRTHDEQRWVRFEVHDTGPGVDPALKARIFDPYVRAAEATIPGLGLGLATVRRLVEAHHGSVGIRSAESGPGSVFWFELPKAETASSRGAAAPPDLAPAPG